MPIGRSRSLIWADNSVVIIFAHPFPSTLTEKKPKCSNYADIRRKASKSAVCNK